MADVGDSTQSLEIEDEEEDWLATTKMADVGDRDSTQSLEIEDEEEDWLATLCCENDSFSNIVSDANVSQLVDIGDNNDDILKDNFKLRPNSSVSQKYVISENFEASDNSEEPVHRMALNDHKAGMTGLDKEKINKIIFEASKGSKFYENERKKEQKVAEKIKSLQEELKKYSKEDFSFARKSANRIVKEVENGRDLSRIIVHIDMDAFYAAVETRDNPSLKDVPMAVGSTSMLSTSNYAARKYGVRAAMPGFIAKKLCPQLIIVPQNFKKYRSVSGQVRKILGEYDPNFCGMGLDEAYLDLTEYVHSQVTHTAEMKSDDNTENKSNKYLSEYPIDHENNSLKSSAKQTAVEKIVNEIRSRIYEETKLTASAGIAANTLLAKICSDINKPNGQYYLPQDKCSILNFVKDLPIRKVSGIGRVSEQILNSFGIITCNDLYRKRELLYLLFSSISFHYFMRISLGISSTSLDNDSDRKSMSTETTFGEMNNPEDLFKICHELCQTLSGDLHKEKLSARSITLKMKLINFEVRTRTKTINNYIQSSEDIFSVAKEILGNQIRAASPGKLKLRLMGVRVSEFGEQKKQNKLENLFLQKKCKTYENGQSDKQVISNKRSINKEDADGQSKLGTIPSSEHKQETDSNKQEGIGSDDQTTRKVISPLPFPLEIKNGDSHKTEIPSSLQFTIESCAASSHQELPVCPVCLAKQPLSTDINEHIDSCLNKQAIRDLLFKDRVEEENTSYAVSHHINGKVKRKTINQKRKSSENAAAPCPAKKRTLINIWKKK